MSSVYVTEPPTSGKVVLHTTHGDVDVELWAKECPKACRAFLQLCLEGYYDAPRCPFARVIPNLMVETGADAQQGQGLPALLLPGAETHSRLRFSHRGQVAAVGAGSSDFFITLDKCEWLNAKHCVFATVRGPSFFNVLRIGEADTDKDDRPFDPPQITSVEVVLNPFDDIVVRPTSRRAQQAAAAAVAPRVRAQPQQQRGGGKRAAHLLSFAGRGEDDDNDGGAEAPGRQRGVVSMHEAAAASAAGGGRGSRQQAVPDEEGDRDVGERETAAEAAQQKRARLEAPPRTYAELPPVVAVASSSSSLASAAEVSAAASARRAAEYLRLQQELRSSRRAVAVATGAVQAKADEARKETLDTPLQLLRSKYAKRKRDHGEREAETLAKLAAFQNSLRAPVPSPAAPSTEAGGAWHSVGLRFTNHIDDASRGDGGGLGNHAAQDSLVTIDSRTGRAHSQSAAAAATLDVGDDIDSIAAALAADICSEMAADAEEGGGGERPTCGDDVGPFTLARTEGRSTAPPASSRIRGGRARCA